MRHLKCFSVLAMLVFCATSVHAFDLAATAAVEIVEGISIAQTTQMDFGQVADHDGNLVLGTDPATAMTDASFISFDSTGYTPGIFTLTTIAGASVNCSIVNDADVAGLTLSAWTISLDAGVSDEGDITDITALTDTDTWNIGATLAVASAAATIGAVTPGYTITVVLN